MSKTRNPGAHDLRIHLVLVAWLLVRRMDAPFFCEETRRLPLCSQPRDLSLGWRSHSLPAYLSRLLLSSSAGMHLSLVTFSTVADGQPELSIVPVLHLLYLPTLRSFAFVPHVYQLFYW
jgi:hypothetical protein